LQLIRPIAKIVKIIKITSQDTKFSRRLPFPYWLKITQDKRNIELQPWRKTCVITKITVGLREKCYISSLKKTLCNKKRVHHVANAIWARRHCWKVCIITSAQLRFLKAWQKMKGKRSKGVTATNEIASKIISFNQPWLTIHGWHLQPKCFWNHKLPFTRRNIVNIISEIRKVRSFNRLTNLYAPV